VYAPLAFSLLEIIAVLVIMSMGVALVAPTLARSGGKAAERRAMAQVVDALRSARVDAIRAQQPRTVRVTIVNGAAVAQIGAEKHTIDPWPIASFKLAQDSAPVSERHARRPLQSGGSNRTPRGTGDVRVIFQPSGRTDALAVVADSLRGARLWRITFDPVSGAPTLARVASEDKKR